MTIVQAVGKCKRTVDRWQKRYMARGLAGLKRDATRRGRKPPLAASVIERVVDITLHDKPPAATHWSAGTLARAAGISHTSVQRIWHAHGLKPHLVKTFQAVERQTFHREGSRRQRALSRPAGQGRDVLGRREEPNPGARSHPARLANEERSSRDHDHDYERNGTTTLFAALNVATGRVIGQCMKRHRHQEWLKFLRTIDRATPQRLDVHLIADNYATHKHAKVKAWLKRHPRFHMHFTPTSSSWLNQVERFFGRITDERIRRGVFKSVAELETAIKEYLDHQNADPKPFVWTATATAVLEKVARGRQVLESAH
jgi:transposase